MALRFLDGLDRYDDFSDITTVGGWGHSSSTGSISYSTTAGRFGGGCLTGSTTTSQYFTRATSHNPGETLYIAFAIFHSGGTFSSADFLSFYDTNNSAKVRVQTNSSGAVLVRNASGQFTTSSGSPLSAGAWHWVEIEYFNGTTSSNSTFKVRVDNTEVVNATAQNMTGSVAEIRFQTVSSTWRVDDVVVWDPTGATFNTFPIDDSRVDTLLPTGDGGVAAWTPTGAGTTNSDRIDDPLGSSDGDTTYISSSTATQENRISLDNLSVTPTTIHTVQVTSRMRKSDAGSIDFRHLVNSNAVEGLGATDSSASTSYLFKTANFELNPDGNVAWTKAAVDALEVGVEIV